MEPEGVARRRPDRWKLPTGIFGISFGSVPVAANPNEQVADLEPCFCGVPREVKGQQGRGVPSSGTAVTRSSPTDIRPSRSSPPRFRREPQGVIDNYQQGVHSSTHDCDNCQHCHAPRGGCRNRRTSCGRRLWQSVLVRRDLREAAKDRLRALLAEGGASPPFRRLTDDDWGRLGDIATGKIE